MHETHCEPGPSGLPMRGSGRVGIARLATRGSCAHRGKRFRLTRGDIHFLSTSATASRNQAKQASDGFGHGIAIRRHRTTMGSWILPGYGCAGIFGARTNLMFKNLKGKRFATLPPLRTGPPSKRATGHHLRLGYLADAQAVAAGFSHWPVSRPQVFRNSPPIRDVSEVIERRRSPRFLHT